MWVIWLVAALTVGIKSQAMMEQEPACEQFEPYPICWRLKGYYDGTFGIIDKLTEINRLDVRQTNIFPKLQQLSWSDNVFEGMIYSILRNIFDPYSILQKIVDPYFDYMVGVTEQRVWNYEELDYDIPELKPKRSGTFEEMVRFAANYLQDKYYKGDGENLAFKSGDFRTEIERLTEALSINETNPLNYHGFTFEELVRTDRYFVDYLTNDNWAMKQADRLAIFLKNKAFFQNITDNDDDYDIPTFLIRYPKVIESPKIKPLLRMVLSKEIMVTPDFDKLVFKALDCLAIEYGDSSLFYLAGIWLDREDVGVMQESYEKNFMNDEHPRNPFYWVELADAILMEIEALDTGDIFYNIYSVLLKTKSFVSQLNIESKIYPEYQKLEKLLRLAYFQLLSQPQAIESVLQTFQTEQFWKSAQSNYYRLLNIYLPSCRSPLICFRSFLPSATSWLSFPDEEDMFKLIRTSAGPEIFGATEFFRNFRKGHQVSIFQLKFGWLEPRTLLHTVTKWLRREVPESYRTLVSLGDLVFENSTLFDSDWSSLNTVKDKIAESLDVILTEIEK